MSNKTEKKQEAPKPLNVVQRTERLENVHDAFVGEVRNSLTRVDNKFREHSEILAAIIEIVGQDVIVAKVNERQAARDLEAAEKAAAGVKLLVEQGTLKVVDVIGEDTLIVGKDLDADGNPVGPGRVQVAFRDLKPDFKEKLLGGVVGTKIVTAEDEQKGVVQTFEVAELYELVQDVVSKEEPTQPAAASAEVE